jgi:hypothetical protein
MGASFTHSMRRNKSAQELFTKLPVSVNLHRPFSLKKGVLLFDG